MRGVEEVVRRQPRHIVVIGVHGADDWICRRMRRGRRLCRSRPFSGQLLGGKLLCRLRFKRA